MEEILIPLANIKLKTSNEPVKKKPNSFEYNLEALRGFAALFVVLCHIIISEKLDPNYPTDREGVFIMPGHLSVLIFFVLSGYVIGLTNKQPLTGSKIFAYLKKRFIRLYPIYVVSLLLALSLSPTKYSLSTIISNFTFTQVLFSKVIYEVSPIWSLNYEVLYYLLFIPISFFRINPIVVIILSLFIGFGNFFLYPHVNAPIITSYAFGFTFWCMGLVIAKYYSRSKKETDFTLLLSNIFLILCLSSFNVFTTLSSKISTLLFGHTFVYPNSVDWTARAITLFDLSFLPYCLMFILIFSDKEVKFKKQVFGLLQFLPAFTFIYMIKSRGTYDISLFLLHSIFYILSILFLFVKVKTINLFAEGVIRVGIWLGGISYGIYIIHFPILILFSKVDYFSGTAITFAIRVILFIIGTFYVSFLLEKWFQPWIKQKFE